jgi:hypothetical protein
VPFSVPIPTEAQRIRLVTTSRPISSIMSSVLAASISSSGLPSYFSATIDAPAWLIVQPSPSKRTSSAMPSRIFRYIVTTSPQPGIAATGADGRILEPALVAGVLVVVDQVLDIRLAVEHGEPLRGARIKEQE